MKITEESLECSECSWRGYERDAIPRRYGEDDAWYECPACHAGCAHFPLDELDA
jgi:hypothetical protein